MTYDDVVTYHRTQATLKRAAGKFAAGAARMGCEDAFGVADGWEVMARQHDEMATVLETTHNTRSST